jgi:hypothetical protein
MLRGSGFARHCYHRQPQIRRPNSNLVRSWPTAAADQPAALLSGISLWRISGSGSARYSFPEMAGHGARCCLWAVTMVKLSAELGLPGFACACLRHDLRENNNFANCHRAWPLGELNSAGTLSSIGSCLRRIRSAEARLQITKSCKTTKPFYFVPSSRPKNSSAAPYARIQLLHIRNP